MCLLLSNRGILQHMRAYEKTLDITYAQSERITALLEAAGQRCKILFYTFHCDLGFYLTRQKGSEDFLIESSILALQLPAFDQRFTKSLK